MANELKFTISGQLKNGTLTDQIPNETYSIDQATKGLFSSVELVPTSEENMPVGDVATLGYIWMKNLDDTNYIEWGPSNAGSMVAAIRLAAGKVAVMPLKPGTTYRWVANAAAVRVQIKIFEA